MATQPLITSATHVGRWLSCRFVPSSCTPAGRRPPPSSTRPVPCMGASSPGTRPAEVRDEAGQPYTESFAAGGLQPPAGQIIPVYAGHRATPRGDRARPAGGAGR